MSTTVEAEVRPFRAEFGEEQIDDLRRRIVATRWPSRELVDDRSQGVQLATLKALAEYWAGAYDFGRVEERLNALPQFTTEIDGVEIHFVHVRSQHEDALPLIMTHGWPGSVVELLETVGPLTDPSRHGGRAYDAFHLVLPSLPGYAFSDTSIRVTPLATRRCSRPTSTTTTPGTASTASSSTRHRTTAATNLTTPRSTRTKQTPRRFATGSSTPSDNSQPIPRGDSRPLIFRGG